MKNDGGQAFPGHCEECECSNGMTLRQWYAGQALQGLLANPAPVCVNLSEHEVVGCAVSYADALLKALESP